MRGALGRKVPTDWGHVEKYPLTALRPRELPVGVPGVLGLNWYTGFDQPERVGNIYVIGRNFGRVRGGHAICAKPPAVTDLMAWVKFYDQLAEGACVGFSISRMMSLLNRKRYAADWLYTRAQETDEFADTPPAEGSSVRAGFDVLLQEGLKTVWDGVAYGPYLREGIVAYRWATTWDDVRQTLGVPLSANSVPLVNSWGTGYPHVVHLVDEAGERLLAEEGEFGLVTDR